MEQVVSRDIRVPQRPCNPRSVLRSVYMVRVSRGKGFRNFVLAAAAEKKKFSRLSGGTEW
jgi:hypothetical protein